MSHTLGPWYVSDKEARQPLIASEHPDISETLAIVMTDADDAQLMATAPELLEAAKCLLYRQGEVTIPRHRSGYRDAPEIELLRWAVEKAEGR